MKYSDFSRFMTLGEALAALMQAGLAEEEAKSFLIEAIEDKQVGLGERPVHWSGIVREPDWHGSRAGDFVIPSGRRVLSRITLDRADVEKLCELVRAKLSTRRGPKPRSETHNASIDQEFVRMVKAGEVSFGHGGQREAARAIKTNLQLSYQLNSIEKQIRGMYNHHRDKA